MLRRNGVDPAGHKTGRVSFSLSETHCAPAAFDAVHMTQPFRPRAEAKGGVRSCFSLRVLPNICGILEACRKISSTRTPIWSGPYVRDITSGLKNGLDPTAPRPFRSWPEITKHDQVLHLPPEAERFAREPGGTPICPAIQAMFDVYT